MDREGVCRVAVRPDDAEPERVLVDANVREVVQATHGKKADRRGTRRTEPVQPATAAAGHDEVVPRVEMNRSYMWSCPLNTNGVRWVSSVGRHA